MKPDVIQTVEPLPSLEAWQAGTVHLRYTVVVMEWLTSCVSITVRFGNN